MPNPIIFGLLIKSCIPGNSSLPDRRALVKRVWDEMNRLGINPSNTSYIYNMTLEFCLVASDIETAYNLLSIMNARGEHPDKKGFNLLLALFSQASDRDTTETLIAEMQKLQYRLFHSVHIDLLQRKYDIPDSIRPSISPDDFDGEN